MTVEIRLNTRHRPGHVTNGTQRGGRSNNSTVKKPRMKLQRGEREEAQAITAAKRMALVLVEGRHRRLMTWEQWDGMDHGSKP